jgi:hypothetical protein
MHIVLFALLYLGELEGFIYSIYQRINTYDFMFYKW